MTAEQRIYNYLIGHMNAAAACGVLANIIHESNCKSNNLQQSYERSLGFTDETYTRSVDNGSYNNFVRDSAGYGLAQWTYWSRKQALLDRAKKKKVSIGDERMQLEHMISELKGYERTWVVIQNAKRTAQGAYNVAYTVCVDYEAPADKMKRAAERGKTAMKLFEKYADKDALGVVAQHLVIPGDNLTKISKKYGVTIDSIVSGNKYKYPSITRDYIVCGWLLDIKK